MLSCKQQPLEYADMCYLLWSHVEYRIAFLLLMWMFLHFLKFPAFKIKQPVYEPFYTDNNIGELLLII